MKARIIDDTLWLDPTGIVTEAGSRGDTIKAFLEINGWQALLTDIITTPSDIGEICELYLVHINNLYAEEYIQELNRLHPGAAIVIFSGGGLRVTQGEMFYSNELTIRKDDESEVTIKLTAPALVAILQSSMNSAEEPEPRLILSAVSKDIEKKLAGEIDDSQFLLNFHSIFEVDWLLETKLELLHMCLTPEGAEKVSSSFPQELDAFRKDLWPRRLIDINPRLVENSAYLGKFVHKDEIEAKSDNGEDKNWTVKDVVQALAGKSMSDKRISATDPFSEVYITALSVLRDALLYSP